MEPPICMSGQLVWWPGEAGQIWSFCAAAFRATFCLPPARTASSCRPVNPWSPGPCAGAPRTR